MLAIERRNQAWQKELWSTAILVCMGVDRFRASHDSRHLQEFQAYLAAEQYAIEQALRRLGSRRSRRKPHLAARFDRKPDLRLLLGDHYRRVAAGEAVQARTRLVLRQGADACAWEALGRDPRLLRPLFVEGRSHWLPEGVGLNAPMQIAHDLNATGRFFALYNDLTRCLTLGDVTIVRSGAGRPGVPLTMELKSSWVDGEESEAEIDFLSAHSDHPDFAALFHDVRAVLSLKDREGALPDQRAQRQVDELMERTGLLFRLERRLAEQLSGAHRDHWDTVAAVLSRAYSHGSSFDVPEPGVAFAALRVGDGRNGRRELLRLIDRLDAFQPRKTSSAATSEDMLSDDQFSSLVLPIPLWPIPGDLRNGLLAGHLFFAAAVTLSAWRDAFAREEVTLEEGGTEWVVTLGSESARFDVLEVQKLSLGVTVGGVSPRAVAAAVRSALSGEAA